MNFEKNSTSSKRLIITAITRQKKDSSRYSVFINQQFAFGVSRDILESFSMKVGQELSRQQIQDIRQYEAVHSAKLKAMKYISKTMRTELEVRNKLHRQKYDAAVIDQVIENFKEKKYIDDQDYAETFTRDFTRFKKAGIYKLRKKLQEKGVAASDISLAIKKYVAPDQQKTIARELAEKKLRLISHKQRKKEKIYRYLMQKGFDNNLVSNIISDLFKDG